MDILIKFFHVNKKKLDHRVLEEDAHQKKKENLKLEKVFTIREKRTLSKGLSFQYKNVFYQLKNSKKRNRLRSQKIQVLETLDGELIVETLKGENLEAVPYNESRGEIQRTIDSKEIGSLWANRKQAKPKRKHPWR